ncbi:MAG: PAS domain S-box protein [Gemmatimonadetes bacterium]|nr:PAS domain S-box protein [Gemmatimonadota bacterium]
MPCVLAKPASVRTHLAALALAAALPLVLLQAHSTRGLYRLTVENGRASVRRLARSAEAATAAYMADAESALASASAALGPRLLDPAGCGDLVRTLHASAPTFSTLVVVDSRGRTVCAAPAPGRAEEASGVETARLLPAARAGAREVGSPHKDGATGTWVITFAPAIRGPDGAVAGALGGTIPLARFQDLLGGVVSEADELVTVADASGFILARSLEPGRWVGRSLEAEDGYVGRVWTGVRMRSLGWVVHAGIPTETVVGPARAAATERILWTALIVLLAGLLAQIAQRRISGAIRTLVASTRAMADGAPVPALHGAPAEVMELATQLGETLEARRRAEAAERLAKERYRSIFDNALFGIYISTPDGRFLEANTAFASMLGYDEAELKALGPTALYRDPQVRDEYVSRYLEERIIQGHEMEWVRKDGATIIVRLSGRLVPMDGGAPAFEVIAEDITAGKKLQEQLRHTQKMEALGRLAGGVAHDFNNLLTVIAGNSHVLLADLAEGDPLAVEIREIADASARAEALTRQLLAFSRKDRAERSLVDLNELIVGMERMLTRLVREDIRLHTVLDPGTGLILADRGQIEQVIVNLAVNAKDAMPDGGEIHVSTRWALAGPPKAGKPSGDGWVCLTVADTGVGMDEATRERVFEPFFTTKVKGSGTGLGLATAYAIVEASGGHILVESAPGAGARFEVWLPSVAAFEESTERSPEDPSSEPRGVGTVLVVEDEAPVRRIVERVLRSAGYRVLLASDGAEAVQIADRYRGPISLVVTDVIMPVMKGGEVAEHIERCRPGTPVLFMSGYVDSLPVAGRVSADPDTFLPKPFTPNQLRARVKCMLDRGAGNGCEPAIA